MDSSSKANYLSKIENYKKVHQTYQFHQNGLTSPHDESVSKNEYISK